MTPEEIRESLGRFRALIIGRPNAGKTTILRSIARSADGRVDPSSGRGIHNIEQELVFESNPRFVFHDSRGIESGSTDEMDAIQAFISERANARSLNQKLHAIWYCIPTDNARLVAAAEEQFFDKIKPNGVPVILIFTKFESQEADAFNKLLETPGCSIDHALSQAAGLARQTFDKEHLSRFNSRKYPPKEIIYLKDMDKEDATCSEIVELTTEALNNDTLKWLLATVQEVNLGFRTRMMLKSPALRHALESYSKGNLKNTAMAREVWKWYPHLVWQAYGAFDDRDYDDADGAAGAFAAAFNEKNTKIAISPLISKTFPWSDSIPWTPKITHDSHRLLYFVASLAISAEHSYWLSSSFFPQSLKKAAEFYKKSPSSILVVQQIQDKFPDNHAIIGESHIFNENQISAFLSEIINSNILVHKPRDM